MSLLKRVFLPVLIVILIMPLATYAIFLAASEVYVKREAESRIYQTLDEAASIARTYLENLDEGEELDAAGQRSLLKDIRLLSRGLSGETFVISLNSKYKITFPVVINTQPEAEGIAGLFVKSLAGEDNWLARKEGPIEISVDSTRYVVCATELIPDSVGRAKYIIVYNALFDLGNVLASAGRVVLAVCCLLALATLALLFMNYRAISESITRIITRARASGGGHILSVEARSGIKEIDELISEINAMACRINRYDAEQKVFFQNASHELRTPLMSIRGYAECIECGVFDDVKRAAGVIVRESDKLNGKLSKILDISRLDGDAKDQRYTVAKLGQAVQRCADEVRGQAMERGVDVTLVTSPEVENREIPDLELFDMALGNVLSNAVRHAATKVEIRSSAEERRAVICVTDDGPGFDPDDLPHVFERFYKGKSGVSGLGLSIAGTAAQKMGGSIEARNDAGAVVTIYLPANQDKSITVCQK